jgi:hypothetical protein
MKKALSTPQVITKTVTELEITSVVHNFEEGSLEVHYMTFLDDGTPHMRANSRLTDEASIAAMYASIDASVLTGKTVREAIDTIISAQILGSI